MVPRFLVIAAAAGVSLAVAACGNTTGERAVTGAGIGAAGGAVIGAVTPIGPAGGALIGAAVGGATGALTTPSQVNVGKPTYRRSASAPAGDPTVRNIQGGLQHLGYHPGAADGRMGPKTAAAIKKYQKDNGMPEDGQPSQALWDNIHAKTG